MGHDLKLALGMKFNQISDPPVPKQKVLPIPKSENSLNEILPDIHVVETPFLLNGQKRKVLHYCISKETSTGLCRHPAIVNLHAKKPRTGGILLEDKAAQVFLLQFHDRALAAFAHSRRKVDTSPVGNKTRSRRVPLESHRLARYRQPAADLGTYRYKAKKTPKSVSDIVIVLVTTIIADLFPKETGTDANSNGIRHKELLWHASRTYYP